MVKIIFVLLFFVNIAIAGIQVTTNKTKISSIESLSINIKVDNNRQPNISPLNRDFHVSVISQFTSDTLVNGKAVSMFNLKLTLKPKRTGDLLIPSLSAGKERSKAIKIKVSEVDERSFEKNIVFIKSQISNAKPLVQQQVIYTVSFYSRAYIQNININFTPKIADTLVKKISNSGDKMKMVTFKGKKLWRKDFNFALYPQKIGKLSIPSIRINVNVNRKNILLFSKSINLNILPSDKNYPSGVYWLPATNVELFEEPLDKKQKIIAGEPIIRKFSIKVSAQSAEQVPALDLVNNTLFEQYADQSSSTEKLTSTNILSTVKQNILFIANKSGEQAMPAMSLTWFDTNENKTKIARIPATKITVSAPSVKPKKLVLSKLEDNDIEFVAPLEKTVIIEDNYWKFAAFFMFALWLLTLLLGWFYRPLKTKKTSKTAKTTDVNQLKMINKYAQENDIKATKRALDAWVFQQYGLLDTNLFAQQLGDDFAAQVLILQQTLYKSNKHWDGKKFHQVFTTAINQQPLKKHKQVLPNLYPS